jgi:ABC-2 type transport system permease protein
MDSLLRILALAKKELLAVLKDKVARTSLLVPPILQAVIFGYAATYDLNHVPYAVLDQDNSGASRELLARFDGSGVFERVGNLHSVREIRSYIDAQHALIVVQINQNFERQLLAGQKADVQVVADGRNSNTAATAMGYVSTIVESFNNEWRAAHGQQGPSLSVVARAWFNPNLETRWNMIPGMIGMLTLLQTLLLTAMSVAREREQGTFDQLLVTPFRPFEIMVGKAMPSVFIGMVQASGILLVAQLWFRIPFAGSFLALYAGLLLFILAAVGIGLQVSAISQNMQQAMLSSFFVMVPFAMLSGLTTPIMDMPKAVQAITYVNPLRYATDFTQRVYLEGASLFLLWYDLWPLALIASVTLTGAAWMFRHRLH